MNNKMFGNCKMLSLPISEINKSGCQRNLNKKRAREIGQNWKWFLYQPITVNLRAGVYRCVDGQHRLEGAKIAGIKTLPCWIIQVSESEEYVNFVLINNKRVRVSAYKNFINMVASQDKEFIEIAECFENNGLTLAYSGNGKLRFRAIGSLMCLKNSVEKEVFMPVLEMTIETMAQCWPADSLGMSCDIFMGMFMFFQKVIHLNDFDLGSFKKKLSKYSPANVIAQISGINRFSRSAQFYKDIYNHGRHRGRIEDTDLVSAGFSSAMAMCKN